MDNSECNKTLLVQRASLDSHLDGSQITGLEILRVLIEALKNKHPQIHTKMMGLIVHELARSSTGLRVELNVFT
jgi:hypothetical protein